MRAIPCGAQYAVPDPGTAKADAISGFSAKFGGSRICRDSWEDLADDSSDVSDKIVDVFANFDPWAKAVLFASEAVSPHEEAWNQYIKPPPPPDNLMRVSAPAFFPDSCSNYDRVPDLRTMKLMQDLIDRQNDTIAVLTEQIDAQLAQQKYDQRGVDFGSSPGGTFEGRMATVEKTLHELSKSLGTAVQESIDKRLAIASFGDEVHFHAMLRPHLEACVFPAIQQSIQEGLVQVVRSSDELFRGYDKIIQRQLAEIRGQIHLPPPPKVEFQPETEFLSRLSACREPPEGSALGSDCVSSPMRENQIQQDATREDRCSISEFLRMAHRTQIRLPHRQQAPRLPFSIRGATDFELIHIIHCERKAWGQARNLGPYTLQQAICLHIASCGDLSEQRAIELEELAKQEDFSMSSDSSRNHTSHNGACLSSASVVPMSTCKNRKLG